MKVLLCGRFDPGEEAEWRLALAAAAPQVRWLTHEQALAEPRDVAAAVVANPPPGSLQGLPALRLVQSLWAGVDRLLDDPTLPADVPLARMVDPAMTAAMVETATWAVLSLHRGFFTYAAQQRQARWQPLRQRRADEVPVLVLGQGALGSAVGRQLAALGYPVQGWRRADGATPLLAAVSQAAVVVNLLPLTPQTRGLLDARVLAAMAPGSGLVNLARGAHLVEADLLAALDRGRPAHAVLDVFAVEPLPPGHPFWHHPQVTVLPHAAAATDARSAAGVVAENLRRLDRGEPLLHVVDRTRGY